MRTVAVVGTSLAGLRAAQELRGQGFDGDLVLVGEEPHPPYDRPPLSKDFLLGKLAAEDLALDDDLDGLQARWHLGVRATALDPAAGEVVLEDGTRIAADGVVVATGGTARALPGTGGLSGVHTLRTLDDAVALREGLAAGPSSVVVIGAGFIGAEVASSCRLLGHAVTVVEALPVPLAGVLGEELAGVCAGLHADHDVRLLAGTGVAGLDTRDGRVIGVRLADGTELPADLVVVGIGTRPATGWLEGSGLTLDDGVVAGAGGLTANRCVAAVGDVARCAGVRTEHWTAAAELPAIAVRNLLAGSTVATYARPGYFWSDQYGRRIQFAGSPAGEVQIVEGDPAARKFVAVYRRHGVVVGVLAFDSPRPFTRLRRSL